MKCLSSRSLRPSTCTCSILPEPLSPLSVLLLLRSAKREKSCIYLRFVFFEKKIARSVHNCKLLELKRTSSLILYENGLILAWIVILGQRRYSKELGMKTKLGRQIEPSSEIDQSSLNIFCKIYSFNLLFLHFEVNFKYLKIQW